MLPRRRALLSVSSLVISSLLISSCYSPERVQPVQASDSALSCTELQQEISYAEQARAAAREHDKFEFRYMLIVPAFVSAYNFSKAEKAADARKENLESLYASKNCASQPQTASPLNGGEVPGGFPGGGFPGAPSPDAGFPGGGFPGGELPGDEPSPFGGGFPPR